MVSGKDSASINEIYAGHNMMKGIAPGQDAGNSALQKANEELKKDDPNKASRVINIPDHIFADFTDVTFENEKYFEFITFSLLIQFLEKAN